MSGYKILIYLLGLFFFFKTPIISMENLERNWKSSLNLNHATFSDLKPGLDEWFLETKSVINENEVKQILKSINKRARYSPNLAKARFIIIYEVDNSIKYCADNLDKLFLSGQFNVDNNARVLAASSFSQKRELDNSEYNTLRLDAIRNLFGCELASGTCSEASILEYIHRNMQRRINIIKEEENNNKFKILGTITQISSLKDPCSRNCMPMLKAYMDRLQGIFVNLQEDSREFEVADILENLVLLGGRDKHEDSRENIQESDEIVDFNLIKPKNRIYSKIID